MRQKHRSVASHMHPCWGRTCNPSIYPDRELNRWPFPLWNDSQPTEPHPPGPEKVFLNLSFLQQQYPNATYILGTLRLFFSKKSSCLPAMETSRMFTHCLLACLDHNLIKLPTLAWERLTKTSSLVSLCSRLMYFSHEGERASMKKQWEISLQSETEGKWVRHWIQGDRARKQVGLLKKGWEVHGMYVFNARSCRCVPVIFSAGERFKSIATFIADRAI